MTIKRKSLGRGLQALLGAEATGTTESADRLQSLPVHMLTPGAYQPRQYFDEKNLEELADSIRQQGILQPLIVRNVTHDHYEILAGERRYRAAIKAGLTDVPVIIKAVDAQTAMVIALIENLQRDDLNPLEEARAMLRLCDECDLTHQDVANLLGKSRTTVSNALRILSLPDAILHYIEQGLLDMGHTRPLIGLPYEDQIRIAEHIVTHTLSVRETEQLIARMKKPEPTKKSCRDRPAAHFDNHIAALTRQLDTKITLKQRSSGQGTLQIHYQSSEDLESIFHKLT